MDSADLAFYTTQELIEELTRRTTFLGVVVHSGTDMKNRKWGKGRTFKVRFNSNLSREEAGRLLNAVAGQLGNTPSESE